MSRVILISPERIRLRMAGVGVRYLEMARFLGRRWGLYRSQVPTPFDSPAHRRKYVRQQVGRNRGDDSEAQPAREGFARTPR